MDSKRPWWLRGWLLGGAAGIIGYMGIVFGLGPPDHIGALGGAPADAVSIEDLRVIVEHQRDVVDHLKDQLTWIKAGCAGIITVLSGAVALLFRDGQRKQTALVGEVKNNAKLREEVFARLVEIHDENMEARAKTRETLKELSDAIRAFAESLPCLSSEEQKSRKGRAHPPGCGI